MKVALLFLNYGPYHLARLAAATRECRKLGWEVVGIELARLQAEYDWRTGDAERAAPVFTVAAGGPLESVPYARLIRGLRRQLSEVSPDVVAIAGYAHPAMLSALAWCRWRGRPAILFSESNEFDAPRDRWRERMKGLIVKGFKAALVGGRSSQQYLRKLGMPPDAIFFGYDVVDNDSFDPSRLKALPRPTEQPYFLAVNRFVPKKNLSSLLNAYALYRRRSGPGAWRLVLCGDGPLRGEVEGLAGGLGLGGAVEFPGFLQQPELLPYFAHAGCFILASTEEQWGLVVNEAMAAGLPVLVSERCGCFQDLVAGGGNGYGFDPTDVERLAGLMSEVASDGAKRERMGEASLERIKKFTPSHFADGLAAAVLYATGRDGYRRL
jgi:glycosyltransferase involved in cell wall biosynthesis